MKKRIVISKNNEISSVRDFITPNKNLDNIKSNNLLYCSLDFDNITTYVSKQIWVENQYQYPPYVQCEYVV